VPEGGAITACPALLLPGESCGRPEGPHARPFIRGRGVGGFTVLASPDVFDFARPVTVIADGRTVFSGRLGPSVATLMKWAAIDNDRTMLYGAEIHVRLD